jgi:proton-dependent oligopeptide transporter, POT family
LYAVAAVTAALLREDFAMSQPYATTPPETERMPAGIPYIVGNEAAERFSYYGMRTILVVFMTKYLLDSQGNPAPMTDEAAKAWYHYFVSSVYLFPILGAIIADWLFGKYYTIITLSIVYCIGHFVLALMDVPQWVGMEPKSLLLLGLILIAVGSGGIKPCVSAHVGDQFGHRNQHLLPKVYGWFYFSINFGSTFSTLLTPILLVKYGAGWAFGVPGILMVLATIAFWMGRHKFVHIPPAGEAFFTETFSETGRRTMLNLLPLYVFVAMFWALFDQTGSSWVLQAQDLERTVVSFDEPVPADQLPLWARAASLMLHPVDASGDAAADTGNPVTALEILPAQLQAVNPILVMILIPIFSYGIYPLMGKFFEVTPLRRIGIGLFLTAAAAAVPAIVQQRIDGGATPHMNWQVFAYIIMTAAEVLVSITALEFSYTQAPKNMKSFIMGLFLLSVTLGNVFVGQVNDWIATQKQQGTYTFSKAEEFWFFTACMAAAAVAFVVWSQFYKGRTYIQGTEAEAEAVAEVEGTTGE